MRRLHLHYFLEIIAENESVFEALFEEIRFMPFLDKATTLQRRILTPFNLEINTDYHQVLRFNFYLF